MTELLKGCAVLVASYGLASFANGVMRGKHGTDDMTLGLGAVVFGVGTYAVIVGWL